MSEQAENAVDVARRFSVGHIEQYFGLYAMEEERFAQVVQTVQRMDLASHIQARQNDTRPGKIGGYTIEDGVALIPIVGTMTKYGSSLGAEGSVSVKRAVRDAAADAAVKGIVLVIDSPGGTIAGTEDLAGEVYRARGKKPVIAFADDLAASAAYWVASQADSIIANEGALVGSIGTFMVVRDYSAMDEKVGIKTHVIRAGKFKGAGTPGTAVTDEEIAQFQARVNDINSVFLAGVARGRGMSAEAVGELATGDVWIASKAKAVGLIDQIGTLDDAMEAARGRSQIATSDRGARAQADPVAEQQQETETMADSDKAAPVAATIKEIKEACVGADSDFVLAQVEKGATLTDALKAWAGEQKTRLEAARAEAEDAKKAADASKAAGGVEPIGTQGKGSEGDGGDIRAQIEDKIAVYTKRGMPRHKAHAKVMSENPQLREALVAAAN